MHLSWLLALLASVFAVETSLADVCQYGLAAREGECPGIEKQALKRIASAKTICYSANSEVQWSKNNKEPVGAFATMRAGARSAMKGFTPLFSCERADLVVKIDYDATSPEQVTLAVTDAESGDTVFRESRFVSDLSSDVTRMATHFQKMRSDAVADQVAAAMELEAQTKRKAFFARLPKYWRNPEGLAVQLWVTDGVLYETSTQTLSDSIKLETNCVVTEGADEVTPWTGNCTSTFVWPNFGKPTCTVETQQVVNAISAQEISGQSQTVDTSPLQRTPPACPEAAMAKHDFKLIPQKEQASK